MKHIFSVITTALLVSLGTISLQAVWPFTTSPTVEAHKEARAIKKEAKAQADTTKKDATEYKKRVEQEAKTIKNQAQQEAAVTKQEAQKEVEVIKREGHVPVVAQPVEDKHWWNLWRFWENSTY